MHDHASMLRSSAPVTRSNLSLVAPNTASQVSTPSVAPLSANVASLAKPEPEPEPTPVLNSASGPETTWAQPARTLPKNASRVSSSTASARRTAAVSTAYISGVRSTSENTAAALVATKVSAGAGGPTRAQAWASSPGTRSFTRGSADTGNRNTPGSREL